MQNADTIELQAPMDIPVWKSAVLIALVAGTVALCLNSPSPLEGDNAGVTMDLPARVLHYAGEPGEASPAEKEVLPADTEFARMKYFGVSSAGAEDLISCSVVLSASDRRSLHRPEVCLPGQGWTIRSKETIPVAMKDGRELKVMKLGLSQEREVSKGRRLELKAQFLYWYVGKDVTTPSTERRYFLTAWDNVFRNVNHRWAYVSVMALETEGLQLNGRDSAETQQILEEFIREAVPHFQKTF